MEFEEAPRHLWFAILVITSILSIATAIGIFVIWWIWHGSFVEQVYDIPQIAVNLSSTITP